MMVKINKISPFEGISFLGMNGGNPESPDGKRVLFAVKPSLETQDTTLYVCDRDMTNYRKIMDIQCGNHNGPSQSFIDNSTIVFRGAFDGMNAFVIMDIDTMEIKYKIHAKESHKAEGRLYPFSIDAKYEGKNPDYPEIADSGIYILDIDTGKIKKVCSDEDIIQMVKDAGLTPQPNTAAVSHVQLSPDQDAIMMRLGVEDCPVFGALGCIDLDTGKTHMIPDKPVHQLWYDNDTYMASRQFVHWDETEEGLNKIIECETSYIARFSKDGEELEVLGGISNHMDGSHDRTMFAGDQCYPGYAPDINVYKKGNKKPFLTIPNARVDETIWKRQVHGNPSFSCDDTRVYFNRIMEDGTVEASFVELKDYI